MGRTRMDKRTLSNRSHDRSRKGPGARSANEQGGPAAQPPLISNPEPGFPATQHRTRPACAPFSKERRMKSAKATKFNRKPGEGTT